MRVWLKAINLFLILISVSGCTQNTISKIDLSGEWSVQLGDNLDTLTSELDWNKREGVISLPGSLAENEYGLKTKGSDYGILTPTYKFIGIANYKREIVIPEKWKNKHIKLFLERVLWESKVFIDGKELSVQDALGTPHIHELGKLTSGKHTLEIRVNNDMIHNIGDKGHAYSDYTQSIWNGIVGRIELQAKAPSFISSVRTISDIDKDQLKVVLKIVADSNEKAKIHIEINELGNNNIIHKIDIERRLIAGKNNEEIVIDLKDKLKKWSEFEPTVYNLKAAIKTKKYANEKEIEFGFLKISHNGSKVTINNQPVFLRGNLDCVHFPLTGYPSTKISDWEKIFKTYKSYGLNHVRFHSWCPPEAAFKAANRIGIYIQAEASIWIDWWMSEDMKVKGRPEMDTKGHPKGLGHDAIRDLFVKDEMSRVVDYYGNNPSFIMFCIGNELGNSNFDIMKQWVADLKAIDPGRLYAVSTARKITEIDDYSATHYIQNVGRTRGLNGPGTDWDFEKVYSQMNIPIIAHEIGQWPVYPSWKEIDKYTGVLKARNFEEFRTKARKNGIVNQDEDFRKASGALNQIMYKYEIESFLRTKSCAGIQLLSIQDYQGQGEALIGWLDAHWESKGITTPKKFKQHFNETVPLLRTQKFVWDTDEVFKAKIQLSHYGNDEISNGSVVCKIRTIEDNIVFEKKWDVKSIPIGSLTDIANIELPLVGITKAQELKITLELKNTDFKNEWNIWVYPSKLKMPKNDVLIVDEMNDLTFNALKNGTKVLLIANNLGTETNSVPLSFYPLYWSLTFFPGQGKTNIGMLLQKNHPAFEYFPTSYHSDWQWEPFKDSKAFLLNNTPQEYKPLVQAIDDFHRNNKEGVVFEFKVGKGKLLVSGFNLNNTKLPVVNQLKYSLLKYMDSESFIPKQEAEELFLKDMFPLIPHAKELESVEGLKTVLLKVNAAELTKKEDNNQSWAPEKDRVVFKAEKVNYKVRADNVLLTKQISGWQGKNITINLECPEGILGNFYVQFKDLDAKGREGILEFEGRKVKLNTHKKEEGKWVKFHVMREDSNDGKLELKVNTTKGDNLLITQILLDRE